jgi:Protein of unknown function (DUF1194)
MRTSAYLALAVFAAAAGAPAVAAAPTTSQMDVQLVLAVDISGSMDYDEQRVQRQGYVEAFRDPEVIAAILSGPYARIAVTYVQWAGAFIQQATVPWTVIASKDDALAFANALANAPIETEHGTSISGGLLFAASAFDTSGYDSDRRTIDVSGDGANNDGVPVGPVRDKLVAQGITINGLPILINPSGTGGFGFFGLDEYYHDCVIGGPSSFVIPIKTIADFGPAIRRKLILEVAAAPALPSVTPVAQTLSAPSVNCAAAERSPFNSFTP